jgi:hypothetical protein
MAVEATDLRVSSALVLPASTNANHPIEDPFPLDMNLRDIE